jgi:hypothetical protein
MKTRPVIVPAKPGATSAKATAPVGRDEDDDEDDDDEDEE